MNNPSSPVTLGRSPYFLALSFQAMAILLIQQTMTRMFSLLVWYHFAFLSISLAMLGFAAGGMLVWAIQRNRPDFPVARWLQRFLLAQAVVLPFSCWLLLQFPTFENLDWVSFGRLVRLLLLVMLPYLLAGISMAFFYQYRGENASRLYAFDLAGAALGCLLFFPLVKTFGAPNSFFAIGILLAISALLLSIDTQLDLKAPIAVLVLVIAALGIAQSTELMAIRYVKGQDVLQLLGRRPFWEAWNSHSHIALLHYTNLGILGCPTEPNPDKSKPPQEPSRDYHISPGLSPNYTGEFPPQVMLLIDGNAGTQINRLPRNDQEWEVFRHEVIQAPYVIQDEPHVCIIGPGGGIDVLCALGMGSRKVTAVEINDLIVKAVNDVAAELTGSFYDHPKVELHHDEGRNFLRRHDTKYDIVQISLIDTWAATSAGAYALSENNLYTKDAFIDYLGHLTPRGAISITRFMFKNPHQMLRVIVCMRQALAHFGINDIQKHIFVVRYGVVSTAFCTLSPMDDADYTKLHQWAADNSFEVLYSFYQKQNEDMKRLIEADDASQFIANYPFDIRASTDNWPFFFNNLRWKDFWKALKIRNRSAGGDALDTGFVFNNDAVFILVTFSILVLVICGILVALPFLVLMGEGATSAKLRRAYFYFTLIGMGFMMIEVALMQKLMLLMGHPSYALSIVLFTLLLCMGIGSWLTSRVEAGNEAVALANWFAIALAVLVVMSFASGAIIHLGLGSALWQRAFAAIVILAPLGVPLGTLFPLGLRLVAADDKVNIPLIWGINGAFSVAGAVMAFSLALAGGFNLSFFAGVVCYGVAFAVARKLAA